MGILFSLIFLFAGLFAFVFFIMMITSYLKKNSFKGKKNLIRMVSSAAVSFVALIILAIIMEPTEETPDNKKTIETSAKEESNKESDADKAEKKKAEVEDKKKAEEDKKAAKAEKLKKEKDHYINEVKTKVDTQTVMYDSAWDEIWVPTFEGFGTTIDIYTAYDNMKSLKQRYDTLYSSFEAIEGPKLSKENKKLLKDYTVGMKNAAMWRSEAAEKAMKMFDSGDYSPSKMDEIKADIEYANSEMMNAVIALTLLEEALGVEREE